jgi:hypothetical protein
MTRHWSECPTRPDEYFASTHSLDSSSTLSPSRLLNQESRKWKVSWQPAKADVKHIVMTAANPINGFCTAPPRDTGVWYCSWTSATPTASMRRANHWIRDRVRPSIATNKIAVVKIFNW